MSWQLTTAVSTGDLDSGTYGEVKIASMMHRPNQKLIMVELEYGNTVAGVWTKGHLPVSKVGSYIIQDQEYDDLITTHTSNASELSYVAAKRALYEHLSSQSVIDAGTII